MKPSVLRITDLGSQKFAECIAILRESIPRGEQLPTQRMRELLTGDSYQLLSLGTSEGTLAVAIVYFSAELPFCLLDYMAVRADVRGQGVGSALFHAVVEIARQANPVPDWLLLEVDDDREGTAESRTVDRRRIESYQHLGARLLHNVPYRFPSAFVAPVPMRLMAYPLRASATLSADDLRRTIADVFLNVHGRGSGDELLLWFEASVPEGIEMK